MMEWTIWVAIGALAILTSFPALFGAFHGGIDDGLLLVLSALAMTFWGVFAYNAFEVQITTQLGCCVQTTSYTALGYLAYVFSLGMLAILLKGVIVTTGEATR